MKPIFILPATCELCGNWLPSHSLTCPRNGKHPSQWKLKDPIEEVIIKEQKPKKSELLLL